MSSLHIKIEYPQALAMKREILLLQQSLINAVRHMKEYSSLRRREFMIKNKIKRDLASLRNILLITESELPEEDLMLLSSRNKVKTESGAEKEERPIIKLPKIAKQKQYSGLDAELAEIREKLARLG